MKTAVMAILNSEHKLAEPVIHQETANSQLIYEYFESILPKLMQKSVVIMDNKLLITLSLFQTFCYWSLKNRQHLINYLIPLKKSSTFTFKALQI